MKNFEMFTDEGNALIKGVVLTAKSAGLEWDQVCNILLDISTLDGFGEACDTAVRECVYMALQNQ